MSTPNTTEESVERNKESLPPSPGQSLGPASGQSTSGLDEIVPKAAFPKLRGKPIDLSEMPDSAWVEPGKEEYIRIVGIRFAEVGKVYDYDCDGYSLKLGDAVVVDLDEKGQMMGWVSKSPVRVDNSELKLRLRPVLRKASDADLENFERKKSMEERGFQRAASAVDRLNLKMTVLKVEYTLDRRKAIVYFSAEKRVDFRNLIKELVHDLKAKVDLRQIGARDRSKQIGAIGPCGEETCCSRFIDKFHGVSIKMAKDQNLSLKPTKVSGMCGRLKCCLAYENQVYVEGSKNMPRIGKCVKCKTGAGGTVRDIDIPRQLCLVELDDGNWVMIPVAELVEPHTLRNKKKYTDDKETLVATNDEKVLVDQIKEQTASSEAKLEASEKEADSDENVAAASAVAGADIADVEESESESQPREARSSENKNNDNKKRRNRNRNRHRNSNSKDRAKKDQ